MFSVVAVLAAGAALVTADGVPLKNAASPGVSMPLCGTYHIIILFE